MINENLNAGETVAAILQNALTGEKRVVGEAKKEPRYKVVITVTDLETGDVQTHETTR